MNQTLTSKILLLTSLVAIVALPSASALGASGLVDLDASANAKVDASGALSTVNEIKAEAEAKAAATLAQVDSTRAELEAHANTAATSAQAQADASVEASMSFGARAAAAVQDAFEAIAEFVGGIRGSAHAEVDASAALDAAGGLASS